MWLLLAQRALLLTVSHLLLETIWADFVLKNPLQVDVELTDLTVVVKEAGKTQTSEPQEGLVEVEEIDKISLAPGEQRTVSVFPPSVSRVDSRPLNTRFQSPSNPFDRRNWCSRTSPTNSSLRSLARNPLVPRGDDSTIPPSKDKARLMPRTHTSRLKPRSAGNVWTRPSWKTDRWR